MNKKFIYKTINNKLNVKKNDLRGGVYILRTITKVCIISPFLLSYSIANTQADKKDEKNFTTPLYYFTSSDMFDDKTKNYIQLKGQNYFAKKSNQDINNITLVYNNPMLKTEKSDFRHYMLTPDVSSDEILTFKARHGNNTSDHNIKNIKVVPFLITAQTKNANANYNRLILENGELSSVFYLKPDNTTHIANPKDSKQNQRINFIISPSFTDHGDANFNTLILKKDAYINMGVENLYDLTLNGAPYLIGGVATYGNSTNNTLSLEEGTNIKFFTSLPKKDKEGHDSYDERITHIIGGLAYNGNVKNNKILIKNANMIIHGPEKTYVSSAAAHITAGYIDSIVDKDFEASGNLLDIDGFNIDIRINPNNIPLVYNAMLFADFWGGKTEQGKAINNTINIKNIHNMKKYQNNDSVFAQGLFNFYAGSSNNGEANNNTLNIELKNPLEIANNFTGSNHFYFYGGYGTKGANYNAINIKNDLTTTDLSQSYKDSLYIIAARTLKGTANYNQININNSMSTLPVYIYTAAKNIVDNQDFYPKEADYNQINIKNFASFRNLTLITEATQASNNKISYENVQSITDASNIDKGSKIIIRALNKANNNSININQYSSNAADNAYLIMAYNEAAYNKISINNVLFGVASDKREGKLSIIAGLSNNTHDNTLIINNINLDEYKNQDSIFIAPSAITGINESKSYNNTLYIGGNINIFKDTIIDILSGTMVHYEDNINANDGIAPSAIELSKNNRIVLNTKLEARSINNFEHYHFILSHEINSNTPFLKSYNVPINLSSDGIFALYTSKEQYSELKNKEFIILKSEQGFTNEQSNTLNKTELLKLIQTMKKNKDNFKLKSLDTLKNINLQKLDFDIKISDDAKNIYAKIK